MVVSSLILVSLCMAPSSKSSRQIRFFQSWSTSCRVTQRQLRCHKASVPVQHRRTPRKKSRAVYPDEEHFQIEASALTLHTQLPRHLDSRTHHNLSHPLLRLELLVVRVEWPTPRFSSRGPEDSLLTRHLRDTDCFSQSENGHDSHIP